MTETTTTTAPKTETSINLAPAKSGLSVDMIVMDARDNFGVVTRMTRKWVHVFMLINKYYKTDNAPNYHNVKLYKRGELKPAPIGTRLTIRQKAA